MEKKRNRKSIKISRDMINVEDKNSLYAFFFGSALAIISAALTTYTLRMELSYIIGITISSGVAFGYITLYIYKKLLLEVSFLTFKKIVGLTLYTVLVCALIAGISMGIDNIIQIIWSL
ncbi:MAG TPA: hypothetical protein ENN64_01280 [bacterium]|nr:hypothetical protein [bacterium]